MRLVDVRHYRPERVVTKEETVDLFRHYSKPYFPDEGMLNEVVRITDKLLTHAQFKQALVRGPEEPYYKNFIEMTRKMIKDSGINPKDIGAVAYCGVTKGYLEPATACQMAAHLGLHHVEFFDIGDACNGWSRTSRIVDGLLRRGGYKSILVLSLEFGRSKFWGGATARTDDFHGIFSLRSMKELDWRIWAATIAETGTATLFERDDSNDWYFDYDCQSAEFEDCAFLLPNHCDFEMNPLVFDGKELTGVNDQIVFYAYAKRIGESIKKHLPPLILKAQQHVGEASVIVPHSLSSAVYEPLFRALSLHEKAVYPFNEYGNCVSCGVPAGIAMAIEQGKLKRGDRVVLTPTGSGSSAGVISFKY